MIDQSIFETLQTKLDQESAVRDELFDIVHALARQNRSTHATLSRAHATPSRELGPLLTTAKAQIATQRASLARLAALASQHPFYLYNHAWTRELQDVVFAVLFCGVLGGWEGEEGGEGKVEGGKLCSIEEVGRVLDVPVNVGESDTFHLTIEEYLFAVVALVDELSRLAVNSVTLGEYDRPLEISRIIGEIHAGFQLLNLKNGPLRVKSDSVKYAVKRVEGVVYDLSLRNLIPARKAEGQ